MNDKSQIFTRRHLLVGWAAGSGLILSASARPTLASGGIDDYATRLLGTKIPEPGSFSVTEDNVEGPFYRPNAPFRGMVAPPLAQGKVVLVRGRVYGIDTRKPLPGAVLDIWQADHTGSYDNDDSGNQPADDLFLFRTRLMTDENGYYEYQTTLPGRYLDGSLYRPAHIHYLVRHPGYKDLITQLYFDGDPYNATDRFIKQSLVVKFKDVTVSGGTFQIGQFDVVLDK